MKVAILTPQIGVEGISHFTLNLGKYLHDHDHEVTVVTTCARGTSWERLTAIGLRAVHFPLRWSDSRLLHVVRLARFLARECFDAMISNIGVQNWAGYHCVRFLPESMLALAILQNHSPAVYQGAAAHGDAWNSVVAVSPQVQRMAALHLPGKPVRLISNGIRCPTAAELAQRAPWSTPLRLLFVGRLVDQQKGVFQLPGILRECLAQSQAVTLTVVGDGCDRPELERRFAEEGVAGQVEMVGELPNEVVYATMRSHHVLLLPSRYEGDPLVLKEAMANGCVPVASRLPAITDVVVRDGVDGLLAMAGDSRSFADQVAALSDPLRWRAFSQAGIAHA